MEDKKCCCCERHKERSPEEYKALMNRLNRIEVNAFNKELLASHIRSCVVNDIRDGKDEVIDELVCTLQKLMK